MALFPLRQPARRTPGLRGLAAEIAAIASRTSDALARADLNGLVPRIARIEATLDEMVQEAMAEAKLPASGHA